MSDQGSSSSYDAAALAAAAVAGALAAAVQPGSYDVFGLVISSTILLVVFAYEKDRPRTQWQGIALGAVVGFVALPWCGLPLELLAGDWSLEGICRANDGECRPNEYETAVPDHWLLIAWLVVGGVVAALDRRHQVGRSARQGAV